MLLFPSYPQKLKAPVGDGVRVTADNETSTPVPTEETPQESLPRNSELPSSPVATKTSTPVISATNVCNCELASKPGPMPSAKVPRKILVPGRFLIDEPPSTDQSFESLILDKMKGPTTKPAVKRRKCDLKTRVITNQQLLAELKRQEIEAKEKAESRKRKYRRV